MQFVVPRFFYLFDRVRLLTGFESISVLDSPRGVTARKNAYYIEEMEQLCELRRILDFALT